MADKIGKFNIRHLESGKIILRMSPMPQDVQYTRQKYSKHGKAQKPINSPNMRP